MRIELFGRAPFSIRTILAIVYLAWLPVFILPLIEFRNANLSVYLDVSIYVRLFLSLPILLISPTYINSKLSKIVTSLANNKFIPDSQMDEFKKLIKNVNEESFPYIIRSLLIAATYIGTIFILWSDISKDVSTWKTIGISGEVSLSKTAWWYLFVSQPVYLYVVLHFLYRSIVWAIFLVRVSKLNLMLNAGHGDNTGGLAFLVESVRTFMFPVFALSSIMAANVANWIIYEDYSIERVKFTLGILIFSFVLLYFGPLSLFYVPLKKTKILAKIRFGVFSKIQNSVFEEHWLGDKPHSREDYLRAEAFSAMADANSLVEKAYAMNLLPYSFKDVIIFSIVSAIPFMPVAAIKLPWTIIFHQILKIFL